MEQHLSQYRIFYEVAKAGNISRAAKELYISQPAISKAIGKLESSLGVSLFTRNSRGVHLTDEGELLFVHTKAAFEFLDRGERELKRIREFNIGHLKIGVSNTLCRYILLPYLHQFIQQYPHIKNTKESQSSAHTLSMLEHQQIDLGVVAEPENKKSLAFLPVMDIQDTFVSTKNYMDNLEVKVELIDGSLLDQYGALEKVAGEIRASLRTVLGLDCKVTLVEPRSIERSTGKAKRIVDLRNTPNA